MKRYLVTHDQLISLQLASMKWSADRSVERLVSMDEAQLDCKKIEVPEWATTIVCHGIDDNHDQQSIWLEIP